MRDKGGRGSGGESFGLIDRANHGLLHPELLKAMLDAANGSSKLADITPPAAK
jgi:hypothetical protein